jgi:hypothetical protein
MTRIAFLLSVFVLLIAGAHDAAAMPSQITFTGRLASNNVAFDGDVSLKFELFRTATDGTSLWSETQSAEASDGLVAVRLGETTALDESVIDGGDLFLQVTVDGQALEPRLAIGAAPYATRAKHAESADTAESANLAENAKHVVPGANNKLPLTTTNAVPVGIGTSDPKFQLHVEGGTGWGQLAVTSTVGSDVRLSDVDAPVNSKEMLIRSKDGYSTMMSVTDAGAPHRYIMTTDNLTGNVAFGPVSPTSRFTISGLPTAPPGGSTNAGMVCVTTAGELWVDQTPASPCY